MEGYDSQPPLPDPHDLPDGILHHVPHGVQIDALCYELDVVLHRFSLEFRIPLASAVGALEVVKNNLINNNRAQQQ